MAAIALTIGNTNIKALYKDVVEGMIKIDLKKELRGVLIRKLVLLADSTEIFITTEAITELTEEIEKLETIVKLYSNPEMVESLTESGYGIRITF